MNRYKKVFLTCNSGKDQAVSFCAELGELIAHKKIERVDNPADSDFAIVIGGDGTLLNFAHNNVGYIRPVVAINMGSLGFLTDVRIEESEAMIDLLAAGNFRTERRNFLEVEVNGEYFYALNDVVLSKSGIKSRMVTVNVHANDLFLNTYRADGIIVSSPTGSTAYSLSCGGPIMVPGIEAILITPIAVHNLNARPIVLSGTDCISLSLAQNQDEANLMLDGQVFPSFSNDGIVRVRFSEKYIQPVLFPGRTFFSVLREKLRWGEDPVVSGDLK